MDVFDLLFSKDVTDLAFHLQSLFYLFYHDKVTCKYIYIYIYQEKKRFKHGILRDTTDDLTQSCPTREGSEEGENAQGPVICRGPSGSLIMLFHATLVIIMNASVGVGDGGSLEGIACLSFSVLKSLTSEKVYHNFWKKIVELFGGQTF